PRATPLTGFLEQVRFTGADAFNGRFLNLAGRVHNPDPALDTLTFQALAAQSAFVASGGNDLSFSGLSYFGIPAPQEHNRLASPRTLAFFGRFLIGRDDKQTLDYRMISKPDEKILALLGVRYVLADAPLAPPFAAVNAAVAPAKTTLLAHDA